MQAVDLSFGVRTNQFGFNILWATGQSIVVEACTNLATPVWSPLQNQALSPLIPSTPAIPTGRTTSTVSTACARPSLDMSTSDHSDAIDSAGQRSTHRVYRERNTGNKVFGSFFMLLVAATVVFVEKGGQRPLVAMDHIPVRFRRVVFWVVFGLARSDG